MRVKLELKRAENTFVAPGDPLSIYSVANLPPGHDATIQYFGQKDWRIRRIKDNVESDWTESYVSAEFGLAVLQNEYDEVYSVKG